MLECGNNFLHRHGPSWNSGKLAAAFGLVLMATFGPASLIHAQGSNPQNSTVAGLRFPLATKLHAIGGSDFAHGVDRDVLLVASAMAIQATQEPRLRTYQLRSHDSIDGESMELDATLNGQFAHQIRSVSTGASRQSEKSWINRPDTVRDGALYKLFAIGLSLATILLRYRQSFVPFRYAQSIQPHAKLWPNQFACQKIGPQINEPTGAFEAANHSSVDQTAKYRSIFATTVDALVVANSKGIVEDINASAETVLGVGRSEVLGAKLSDLFPHDEEGDIQILIEKLLGVDINNSFSMELSYSKPCGADIDIQIRINAAQYVGGDHIVLSARDVTEHKKSEHQVSGLIAALERSNEELDQFAYIASHDLKAPLRVIANATGWLAEDLAPHLTDDTRESLSLVQSRVRRMEKLLNDLLAHSRIGRDDTLGLLVSGSVLARELVGLLDVPEGF